jgi:tetratricopeptide (TPR) repeat protein
MTRSAAALLLAACSAAAPPPDLTRAERLAHDGRDDDAVAVFALVADRCPVDPRGAQARFCRAALVGRAETLEHMGRHEAAAAAYEAIPARLPRDAEGAASAVVAAARIRLALGQEARAYDLFWHVILHAPETSAADDAVRDVVGDARNRDPRELYGVLRDLYIRLAATAVGDNLLWAMARLARDELHDEVAALADLDRIVVAHKDSPFRDDALFEGAELARRAGDPEGAAQRLRTLLATRESSWIIGSYLSPHLPAAQLELGRVLRDGLHRPAEAIAAFARVEKDYPSSTLVDDALFETAATEQNPATACATLAELARRFPDSKYQLERAPALATRLQCRR